MSAFRQTHEVRLKPDTTDDREGETPLQQERFDTVGVDHSLAWRPGEHREPAVLRRDQGDRAPLIVNELHGH